MAEPSGEALVFSPPELLAATHDTQAFDCGAAPLNQFLQRYALTNQANGSARTFVTVAKAHVFGYYSLAAASVEHAVVPARVSKGLAQYCSFNSFWIIICSLLPRGDLWLEPKQCWAQVRGSAIS